MTLAKEIDRDVRRCICHMWYPTEGQDLLQAWRDRLTATWAVTAAELGQIVD